MPRANRHVLDGRTYHVTHRCHNRSFLLKFVRDRDAYRWWLRQGLQRFDVRVISYCITCNHVHILIRAKEREDMSGLMQYVEGGMAQAFNMRKRRQGAFWSDRYHAAMIEDGMHLWRCLIYIDLNMVRAGAVGHPREWAWTGWSELMGERRRNLVIDMPTVLDLMEVGSQEEFRLNYLHSVEVALARGPGIRESHWAESVAVGGSEFIAAIQQELTRNYTRRRMVTGALGDGVMVLREVSSVNYGA